MKINGIDLSAYGARLTGRTLESAEVNINSVWPEKALTPFSDPRVEYKSKILKLKVEFKGNFNTTEENKSRLLSALSLCTITDYGRGTNTLSGFIKEHSVGFVNNLYQEVEYGLEVIEEKAQVTLSYGSQLQITVDNPGTGISPVKVEFTPTMGTNYTMTFGPGTELEEIYQINNGKSGVMRSISTDGIFEGATNVQKDTIFYSFPRLQPGKNIINISSTSYSLKLIYKPRMV